MDTLNAMFNPKAVALVRATEKGSTEVDAIVLSDNERMLTLVRSLGFKRTALPDGISRIVLRLEDAG